MDCSVGGLVWCWTLCMLIVGAFSFRQLLMSLGCCKELNERETEIRVEEWVLWVIFWQLDESFVRLWNGLPKEKMGRDGGIGLEIEGFQG
ncbi:unnamed protein product [Prunus brigantina]